MSLGGTTQLGQCRHDSMKGLFRGTDAYPLFPCSFLVTKFTSPLTLQVLGNAKGVLAAIISVYVFLNPVTTTGALPCQ